MKMPNMLMVSAAIVGLLSQAPAVAQEYYARHKLEVPTTPPEPPAAWETGPWTSWGSTCSDTSIRTRTVLCKKAGNMVPDTQCPIFDRPATSDVQANYSGCTYAFVATTTPWSESCGAGSTRTTSYQCRRSNGSTVGDEFCEGTKPAPVTETRTSYEGCKAKDWALGEPVVVNACIAGQNETRSTVTCMINGAPAADNMCTGVVKPNGIGSTTCGPVTNNCTAQVTQRAMTSPDRILIGVASTGTRYLDRVSIGKDLCNRYPNPLKRCSGEVSSVGGQWQVTVYGIPANAPNPTEGYSSNGYNYVMTCTQ